MILIKGCAGGVAARPNSVLLGSLSSTGMLILDFAGPSALLATGDEICTGYSDTQRAFKPDVHWWGPGASKEPVPSYSRA